MEPRYTGAGKRAAEEIQWFEIEPSYLPYARLHKSCGPLVREPCDSISIIHSSFRMFGREKDVVHDRDMVHDSLGAGPPYAGEGKRGEEVDRVEMAEEDLRYGGTQRKLKSRHIQLIALGERLPIALRA